MKNVRKFFGWALSLIILLTSFQCGIAFAEDTEPEGLINVALPANNADVSVFSISHPQGGKSGSTIVPLTNIYDNNTRGNGTNGLFLISYRKTGEAAIDPVYAPENPGTPMMVCIDLGKAYNLYKINICGRQNNTVTLENVRVYGTNDAKVESDDWENASLCELKHYKDVTIPKGVDVDGGTSMETITQSEMDAVGGHSFRYIVVAKDATEAGTYSSLTFSELQIYSNPDEVVEEVEPEGLANVALPRNNEEVSAFSASHPQGGKYGDEIIPLSNINDDGFNTGGTAGLFLIAYRSTSDTANIDPVYAPVNPGKPLMVCIDLGKVYDLYKINICGRKNSDVTLKNVRVYGTNDYKVESDDWEDAELCELKYYENEAIAKGGNVTTVTQSEMDTAGGHSFRYIVVARDAAAAGKYSSLTFSELQIFAQPDDYHYGVNNIPDYIAPGQSGVGTYDKFTGLDGKTFIKGSYDEAGVLIKAEIETLDEIKFESGEQNISITMPQNQDVTYKYFYLEDLNTMMPASRSHKTSNVTEAAAPVEVPEFEQAIFNADFLTDGVTEVTEMNDPVVDDVTYEGIKAYLIKGVDLNGTKTNFFAYYGLPEGATEASKVPAVVLVHGAGGAAYPKWVKTWNDKGYAAIAIRWADLAANDPTLPDGYTLTMGPRRDGVFDDVYSNDDTKSQFMYHAVSEAIISNTFLESQPEIDSDKIGICGISWGGIISSYTIGIDNRFDFAILQYGSGYLYESVGSMGTGFGFERNKKMKWDPSTVYSQITTPVLFVNSDADLFFSANITAKSAANISNSQVAMIHSLAHHHKFDIPVVYSFADSITAGTEIMKVVSSTEADGIATATIDLNGRQIKSASLYYNTTGLVYDGTDGASSTDWTEAAATIGDAEVSAELPENAKGYYFMITDTDENVVSSLYKEIN